MTKNDDKDEGGEEHNGGNDDGDGDGDGDGEDGMSEEELAELEASLMLEAW